MGYVAIMWKIKKRKEKNLKDRLVNQKQINQESNMTINNKK